MGPDVTSSVTPHCPDLTPGPSLCEGGCPPTSWLRAAFQAFQPQALRLDTNQHSGFVVVVLESLYQGLLEIYPCKNRRPLPGRRAALVNNNHRRGGLKQQRPESSVGGASGRSGEAACPPAWGLAGRRGSGPALSLDLGSPLPSLGLGFPTVTRGSSLPEMELLGEADPWKPHQHGVRCRASPVPTIPREPRVVSELF